MFTQLVRRHSPRYMMDAATITGTQPDYEACIQMLNNLQTNAQYIKSQMNNSKAGAVDTHNNRRNLEEVQKFMKRAGLERTHLDALSAIHVAGTKGKGTTCAFTESILRHHGYKTGFFSSPHLLEVRERIRINGRPIDKNLFAQYFWQVYAALDKQKSDVYDMPLYFRFLTIMAFKIFLEQKVDVAIVEVGIGGEMDCTNVLRKVPVIGVTSLGIEHTVLLGDTLESIAWNKAGIMKEGCQAFTVPQPDAAMTVLRERSVEKNCTLTVVDSLNLKLTQNASSPARIFNLNAGLAVAMCQAWMSAIKDKTLARDLTETALSNCVWPGRFQVKSLDKITYYIDGAHTVESIAICADWFATITERSARKRALMFNVTGHRDSRRLLKLLIGCRFDVVMFVTNTATGSDSAGEQLDRCQQHKQMLRELLENEGAPEPQINVFLTVVEALEFLGREHHYDLLVTGSLHLVGAVLSIIEPNLNDFR